MPISVENIFGNIPEHLDQEAFDTLWQKGSIKVERIISQGHTSPESGWYDQEQDEWIILLEGCATIAFEDGNMVKLERGDYLMIPAHHKHRVSWTDPDISSIWLAIHA